MSNAKKYYWIKLKTDFFNLDRIDFLLSQKNGCEYVVLYQMLCLITANTGGKLCTTIGEMMIPYDTDKIVRETKHFDFDTVTIALELFKKLGLVYEESDGILVISNVADMVGSECSSAQRVREYRKRKALQCNENETDNSVTLSDKRLEIRDKSIDIDIEKDISYEKDKEKEKKEKEKKEKPSNKTAFDKIIAEYTEDEALKSAIYDFIKMRKAKKAVLTDRALELVLKKLDGMASDVNTKIAILNQSVQNTWTGIFPLKEANNYYGRNDGIVRSDNAVDAGARSDYITDPNDLI